MPTFFNEADTPTVRFDPLSEISPFILFRRLRDGRTIRLIDLRPDAQRGVRLRGSEPLPSEDWLPGEQEEVVLFDQDGTLSVPLARRLQASDRPRVRALFGGIELYEFSLDPEVVGEDTFLERDEGETESS